MVSIHTYLVGESQGDTSFCASVIMATPSSAYQSLLGLAISP